MPKSNPDKTVIQKFEEYDKLLEPSTDSGFISSSNLIESEEINDDPVKSRNESDEDFNKDYDENVIMDSGVCLSDDLSKLSLNSSNLNNLSSSKPVESKKKVVSSRKHKTSELPWKIFFQQDEDGDTHLHTAIEDHRPDLAYSLIRIAPHPMLLDTPNDDALTPLHLAVAGSHCRLVRWLIVAGAKPNPRNLNGDSPLHIAARTGDIDCCRAILYPVGRDEQEELQLSYDGHICAPMNMEQWNYEGKTCVHVAAENGHIQILRQLISCGADINAREGRQGYTALHYAIQRNDGELLKFLMNECAQIDLYMTNYGGRNVLQLNIPVNEGIERVLKQRGLQLEYSSDEDYSSDSEDEDLFGDVEFET